MFAALMDLLVSLLLLGVIAFVFWPDRGLFWRWRRMSLMGERVRTEDALKHLHDSEYRGQPASVQSLAGAIGVSIDKSAALMGQIEASGLLERNGAELQLSADGRSYALRVIRTHRLWERHLADDTGVSEVDWHTEAEHQEHRMSPEETEALASRMGNPRFDPHGDPIPTPAGEIPPWKGEPLTALPIGKLGKVVHVEDEPREIYSQLVAEHIHVGMKIQMLEVSPERIRFWADGDDHVLAPVVAANVTIVVLPFEDTSQDSFDTLDSLEPGESATVLQIAGSCRGLQRRRLMDLGLLPGTVVSAEMTSAHHDPTAYRIRGSLIALRRDQARYIHVKSTAEAN